MQRIGSTVDQKVLARSLLSRYLFLLLLISKHDKILVLFKNMKQFLNAGMSYD